MHIDVASGAVYDFGDAPAELHLESLELLEDAVWRKRKGGNSNFTFADATFAGNPVNGFRIAKLHNLPPGEALSENNEGFDGRQYVLVLSGQLHVTLGQVPRRRTRRGRKFEWGATYELEEWHFKPLGAKKIPLSEKEQKARNSKVPHRWECDDWTYCLVEGHFYEIKRFLGYEFENRGESDVIYMMIETKA